MDPAYFTSFLILDDDDEEEEDDDSSSSSSELLTPLRIQLLDDSIYGVLMASSDVDQKFLGKFAQQTRFTEPLLSQMLYKILGLSVLLSKKLFRARRLRRLDVTRDTKSLQLYHHIIWLSREGLVILEDYVIPLISGYSELKVLAYKLRGSFYHIFVLFHNQPSINRAAAIPSAQQARASTRRNNTGRNTSIRRTPPNVVEPDDPYEHVAAANQTLPPGLAPISIPKPAASFLLPATDYIPNASACFERAMSLASGLSGSHPLRLSVAVEYCAYRYDCLHDGDGSRRLARATIKAVYNATEGMDDETFADSANLVGVLGKMMKRGLGSSTAGTVSSASRTEKSATPDTRERLLASSKKSSPQAKANSRLPQLILSQQSQRSNDTKPNATKHATSDDSPRSKAKFVRTNKLTTPWEAPPSPEVTRKSKGNTAKELPPVPGGARRHSGSGSRSTSSDNEHRSTRHRRRN